MNTPYVLLGVLILYFLAAAVLIWLKSGSFFALLLTLPGMVFGGVAVLMLGLLWLHVFIPETFETQGGGISLIVGYVPFFLGSGILVGVWSVAFGYWFWAGRHDLLLGQGLGLISSSILGSVLPGAIALLIQPFTQNSSDHFTPLLLAALVGSFLSGAIAHKLLHGFLS